MMDTLQGGFQTAPVKLPLTPYQRAVSARETIVHIIKEQMAAMAEGKVRFKMLQCVIHMNLGFHPPTCAEFDVPAGSAA